MKALIIFTLYAICALKFAIIDDIHLDLNYKHGHYDKNEQFPCQSNKSVSTKAYFGRMNCDPPLLLLNSLLHQASTLGMNFTAIITTGDYSSHDIPYSDFNTSWMKLQYAEGNCSTQLSNTFPNIPIAFTIGNSDMVEYETIPNDTYKSQLFGFYYKLWFEDIKANSIINTAENRKTFMNGGYYYFDVSPSMRIICLNSLYYFTENAISHADVCTQQLNWLQDKLAETQALSKQAIILSHFPNGANTERKGVKYYWNTTFDSMFQSILNKYSDTVSVVISGHTHYDDLRVNNLGVLDPLYSSLYNNNIVIRAVTPRADNNPGFSVLDFVGNIPKYLNSYTFLLEKAFDTTSDDGLWVHLYDTNLDLGITDLTAQGIAQFQSIVLQNSTIFQLYENLRKGLLVNYDN